MASVFKKSISDKEYTFYKTIGLDEIVYFIMYNDGNNRKSFRITRGISGRWVLPIDLPVTIQIMKQQFIRAVEENENL